MRQAYSHAKPKFLGDCHRLTLIKYDGEKYIFIYDEDSRAEALRTLGRFASNPELSFTWSDASELSNIMKKQSGEEGSRSHMNRIEGFLE